MFRDVRKKFDILTKNKANLILISGIVIFSMGLFLTVVDQINHNQDDATAQNLASPKKETPDKPQPQTSGIPVPDVQGPQSSSISSAMVFSSQNSIFQISSASQFSSQALQLSSRPINQSVSSFSSQAAAFSSVSSSRSKLPAPVVPSIEDDITPPPTNQTVRSGGADNIFIMFVGLCLIGGYFYYKMQLEKNALKTQEQKLY